MYWLPINYVSFIFGLLLIALSVLMFYKKRYVRLALIVAIIGLLFLIGPIADPTASFPRWFNSLMFNKDI
jgi:hypothetical protein